MYCIRCGEKDIHNDDEVWDVILKDGKTLSSSKPFEICRTDMVIWRQVGVTSHSAIGLCPRCRLSEDRRRNNAVR